MLKLFAVVFILRMLWQVLVPEWFKRMCLAIVHLLTMLAYVRIHGYRRRGQPYSFVDEIEERVDQNPQLIQLICVEDDRKVTLQELDEMANQLSHWGIEQGYKCRFI